MKIHYALATISVAFLLLGACENVDITKTAKGYYAPTNPNNVEILATVPSQPYVELGTLTVTGFDFNEEAKMHNAIRSKAAPLGANAVIIQNQGVDRRGNRWVTGVAIRFK
jgi:hypothetical protein